MVTHRLVASEALVGGGAYFAARILGRPDLVSFRTFESRAVHPRVFDGQSAGIARHHGTEVEAVGRQVRVPTAARGVELPCHVAPTACVRITRRICKIGKFQFNGVRNSLVQGKITNNNALCMGALEEGGDTQLRHTCCILTRAGRAALLRIGGCNRIGAVEGGTHDYVTLLLAAHAVAHAAWVPRVTPLCALIIEHSLVKTFALSG